MAVCAGIDLHSTNSYLAVVDGEGKEVYKKKLPNDGPVIPAGLEAYRKDLKGVVIESAFNWYWIVDLLMDEGYGVHLANPAGIQKYKGLKHSDDRRTMRDNGVRSCFLSSSFPAGQPRLLKSNNKT